MTSAFVPSLAKPLVTNINTNRNFNYNIIASEIVDIIGLINQILTQSSDGNQVAHFLSPKTTGSAEEGQEKRIKQSPFEAPPTLEELTEDVHRSSGNNLNINSNYNFQENSIISNIFELIINSLAKSSQLSHQNLASKPFQEPTINSPSSPITYVSAPDYDAVSIIPIDKDEFQLSGVPYSNQVQLEAAKRHFLGTYKEIKNRVINNLLLS